jgi:hypothetical protein
VKQGFRFTWQLVVAIACAAMMAGYIVNFVSGSGYNRPALLFAWIFFMAALILYQQHRKALSAYYTTREQDREEAEYREWANSQKTSR